MSNIPDNYEDLEPALGEGTEERKPGRPPIASRKFDRVEAAIWRHEDEYGKDRHSVTLSRSYLFKLKDGSEEWRSTSSYHIRDLPHCVLGLFWAILQLMFRQA